MSQACPVAVSAAEQPGATLGTDRCPTATQPLGGRVT